MLLACMLVFLLLLPALAPAQSAPHGAVRLERELVSLNVSVMNRKGQLVVDLDRSHFEVFEDGVKQEIAFFSDEDQPITVGILVDVSRSMEKRIAAAREAVTRFVETSHPEDEFFLVTFADRPELSRAFAADGRQIVNDLIFARPNGNTALHDAVVLGLERLERGRHQRRALLIVSDGQDNNSRYGFGELKSRLEESSAVVYAIGVTDMQETFPEQSGQQIYVDERLRTLAGKKLLGDIAEITGGRACFQLGFLTDRADLIEASTAIAVELRRWYGIGYYPSRTTGDGKFHEIEVTVRSRSGERLSARTRRGYIAPNGSGPGQRRST